MIYGHSRVVPSENGSPVKAGEAASRHAGQPSWKALSEVCRLALIERALSPANDQAAAF